MGLKQQNHQRYQPVVDLYLQMGHIHEVYRFDTTKALEAYEAARKTSSNAEQKEWIDRKIQFLKNPSKVGVDSTGVETRNRGGS